MASWYASGNGMSAGSRSNTPRGTIVGFISARAPFSLKRSAVMGEQTYTELVYSL